MTFGLTLLPLLHLEGEVEGADGEVDGLGVCLAHGAEEIEDVGALATDQTGQQLGNQEGIRRLLFDAANHLIINLVPRLLSAACLCMPIFVLCKRELVE